LRLRWFCYVSNCFFRGLVGQQTLSAHKEENQRSNRQNCKHDNKPVFCKKRIVKQEKEHCDRIENKENNKS